MARKRTLFLSTHFPNPSQPNNASFVRQQIQALSHHCDVDVVAPIPWHVRGRNTIPYSYTSGVLNIYHPLYVYIPRILRWTHGYSYVFSVARLIHALFKAKGYDGIYSAWLYPDAYAAAYFSKAYGVPLYTRVMGTDVNRLTKDSDILSHSLYAVSSSKYVLSVSANIKKKLIWLGADGENIQILRNGIDRSLFYHKDRKHVREILGIQHDAQVILFVGNLKIEKGVFDLFEAFVMLIATKTFPNLHLYFVGDGPMSCELSRATTVNGCTDNVHVLKSKPHSEIADWMNACDVFCLPSHSEGLPNVVIESLSCGAKVVATNVGGTPELVSEFAYIRLVNPHSPGELKAALEDALLSEESPYKAYPCLAWNENSEILFRLLYDMKKVDGVNIRDCPS